MSPQPRSPNGPPPIRRHLLLIEQQITERQSLYDLLSRHGISVYTARSADMALVVLGYDRPDLILLDPNLPDMTGLQLIERLRSFNPTVPILLLGSAQAGGLSAPAMTSVQGRLDPDMPEEGLLGEITRWLDAAPAAADPVLSGAVLLIDDEDRMRIIMQNLLELNGFTVTAAASGEEGLARLARSVPDAVMLDVRMPGMDGLVVLKKIRETHPQLPVILVTHVDEESAREEALRLGANAYVTKPFNFDGLKQVLRQAIPGGRGVA